MSYIGKDFLLARAFENFGDSEELGNFHTILSYFSPDFSYLVGLFHRGFRVVKGMEQLC